METHAPRNVVMPIGVVGDKRPLYPHKGSQWSWRKFHFVDNEDSKGSQANEASQDFCVILQTLCVIDVDSASLAMDLEARFPILKEVPRELTRRGMHYWFKRSALADEEAHFDGCAQVGLDHA